MEHHQLFFEILKNTFTKTGALRRLRILREYLEHVFFSENDNTSLADFLEKQNISPADYKTILSWEKLIHQTLTQDNFYAIINSVSQGIKVLPTITLFIPYEPTEQEIEGLGNWFRKNISRDIILEIQQDDEKIGGCALIKKGVYSDYSLTYFIQSNKDAILNLISEYANKQQLLG